MSTVKQLAKEQRARVLGTIQQHNHRDFLSVMMGKDRNKVLTMTFEAYQPEWLEWWTVAELQARFSVPSHRIRRAIRLGIFERYTAHDDHLLRVRLGDFIDWFRTGCKTEREAA